MEDGFSSYSSLYDTSSLLQFCNVVDPEETVYAYLTNIYHTKLKSPSVFSEGLCWKLPSLEDLGFLFCTESKFKDSFGQKYAKLFLVSPLVIQLFLFLCVDDSASAASSMEVTDRIASLEQRVQMQEDDIQLLKSALADVVRRLNITEEQQAMQNKKGPTKDQSMIKKAAAEAGKHVSAATTARPLVQTLPLRTTVNNGTVLPKKPSGSLPSPSGTRKETVPPAAKRSVNLLNACKLKKPALRNVYQEVCTFTSSAVKPTPFFLLVLLREPALLSVCPQEAGGKAMEIPKGVATALDPPAAHPVVKRTVKGFSNGHYTQSLCVTVPYKKSKPKEPMFSAEEGYVKMFLRGRPVTMYMPKEQVESYNLEAKVELPAKRLKLDYGYRGRDCRSNLYLLPTGETVYFIASVVVLFNVEEQLQRHYTGHNDDVKCLAVHPDRITIATGQVAGTSKDGKQLPPHVRVWDSVTLNTLHVIGMGFFDRAVTCIAFSKSVSRNGGSSLCSVDDSNDHVLSVWDWQKEEKLADVKCLFSLYPGTNRISHAVQGAHEGGIFALCMLRDGTLVSGGGKDRKLISWNGNYQKLHKTEVKSPIPEQFGPIRTVAEGKGDVVLIGTTRNFVLQGTLSGDFFPITQGHTDELWGLAVHSSKPQFFTCGHDKHITLWDAMTHRPIWNKIIEDPAQSSGFHPSAAVVAVGTLTGRWFVFDTETKDLVTVHTDGNEQLSVMRYSPDGNFLAIGSHDNSIYIYGVNENGRKYTRIGKCSGHSSFITHLDWSVNSQYLVSNSGDYEILYWIPSACKQVVSVETTRDIEWATYTCTLGFHVFGVWPEGSDGTDINAVCRSHGRKLLSTGDDFGKVHLFSYPCSQFRAPSHVYGGHSSHVTNVDFLCEDTHLISTGGKDTSIMQWRVI
ncbi:UNVERIFIED_CONTAM: hypothetical protein H355_004527 [Colinus virginianus]|nr:hypothetical protein H355_004527 [Colinus virginianus]